MTMQDANAAYNAAYDHGYRGGWNDATARAAARIEALEAALREIASGYPSPSDARLGRLMQIARAALAPEQGQ